MQSKDSPSRGEEGSRELDRGPAGDPRAVYRSAAATRREEVEALEGRMRRIEAARLVTFVVGAVLGLLRNDLGVAPVVPTVLSALLLGAFVGLVVRHRSVRALLRRERAGLTLARAGLARLDRDWSALHAALDEFGYRDPLLEPEAGRNEDHAYVHDLDVFGPASVRALMGPTPGATGSETLKRWLSSPALPDEVRRRQGAVRALASDRDGRETRVVEALLVDPVDPGEWREFRHWLRRPPALGGADALLPGWSSTFAWIAPPISVGLAVAYLAGAGLPGWLGLGPLAIQSALSWRWTGKVADYLSQASSRSPGLRRHHPLFRLWETYDTAEPELLRLQGALTAGDTPASREVRRLERWLDAADSRASMFHFVLAGGLLWDVHVVVGLERWRSRAGVEVERWFSALGELEALSAMATLAHDQPRWCFPELRDGVPGLEAEALGHPLLSDAERKTSSVRLEPPGRFLLVTGSNMSGKSTLLRSIGLAAVLGQAGSVICAARAEMTPLRTFTSMRIHDSLTEGVSLFMAELLRLKALVDEADRDAGGRALLYLVDEVLQGTNSEERRVAARRIVRHLLGCNAIGAVTTHDLSLHDDPELDPASSKVHFRETVQADGDRVLTFDYVLRPGLATSRNALKLLRIVGLDPEGTEHESEA